MGHYTNSYTGEICKLPAAITASSMAVDYGGKGGWCEISHRAHPDWVDYQPEHWELGRPRRGLRGTTYLGAYDELHLKSCGSLGKHKAQEAVSVIVVSAINLDTVVPMRDILCAVRNGLDFGTLAAIGHIRWKKTLCRECNLRPAQGNSTWNVPCIYRRFLQFRSTSPELPATRDGGLKSWGSPRCDCTADMSEAELGGLEAQGLYKWSVTDGTIKDATGVPPRRLWDLKHNRVVHFHGVVSKLCRECFDAVSMTFISVRFMIFRNCSLCQYGGPQLRLNHEASSGTPLVIAGYRLANFLRYCPRTCVL